MLFEIVGNTLIRHVIRDGKFQCENHSPCFMSEKLEKLIGEYL